MNTDDKNNQLFKKKKFFLLIKKESEIFDFNMLINKFNIKVIILDLLKYEKKIYRKYKKNYKKKKLYHFMNMKITQNFQI